jgi:hypothetical protein
MWIERVPKLQWSVQKMPRERALVAHANSLALSHKSAN